MGLLRTLFLGDIGNHLDIEDTKRDVRNTRDSLRRRIATQQALDLSQNQRIAELEVENQELEIALASLARLLVRKGVVSRDELDSIANGIE